MLSSGVSSDHLQRRQQSGTAVTNILQPKGYLPPVFNCGQETFLAVMFYISFPEPWQAASVSPLALHCCFHLLFGMTLLLIAVSHTLLHRTRRTLCFLEMLGAVCLLFCLTSSERTEAWGKCVNSVNWKPIMWPLQATWEKVTALFPQILMPFIMLGLTRWLKGTVPFHMATGTACESCSIAPSRLNLSSVAIVTKNK